MAAAPVSATEVLPLPVRSLLLDCTSNGPRATEADAVAEAKKAAREEAVAVAEAMKDGTTAGKPISSKENVQIGRLFFNTRGLTA